jgi:uncharacterized DUF497 family protein
LRHIFVWYNCHTGSELSFEWNDAKDRVNRAKHGVSFAFAQAAFLDPRRVIAEDLEHGGSERRYFVLARLRARY